jgi:hypothetical protein
MEKIIKPHFDYFKFFYLAGVIFGLYSPIVKSALSDTDINILAGFKSIRAKLLISDLCLYISGLLIIIGLGYQKIMRSKYSTLKNNSVLINFLLLIGFLLIVCAIPILEKYTPTNSETGKLISPAFSVFFSISIFTFLFALPYIPIIFLIQLYTILTNWRKEENNNQHVS